MQQKDLKVNGFMIDAPLSLGMAAKKLLKNTSQSSFNISF
jgi:hypothetical protein